MFGANDLKPCPFCGGEPEIVTHIVKGVVFHHKYTILCSNHCGHGMITNMYEDYRNAVNEWESKVRKANGNG